MITEQQYERMPERTQEPPAALEKRNRSASDEAALAIADVLGETKDEVCFQLERLVRELGVDQARTILSWALQCEEHGGLMITDGSRRRTVGGIFFSFAYTFGMTRDGEPLQRYPEQTIEQKRATRKRARQRKKEKARAARAAGVVPSRSRKTSVPAAEKAAPSFDWAERLPLIQELENEKGTAMSVKITLTGRPGKTVEKDGFVVLLLVSEDAPSLPRGLPTPTAAPTKYAIYIAAKQWAWAKQALANDPNDFLIVEGFPRTDAGATAIAVFATSVTTRTLQASKRQAKTV